ncbi:MAG TPA: GreA/GreB family elongation factor [Lacipirellula sp.]
MSMIELNDEKVTIGSTVTVRDLESGEIEVYTLVPPSQADIANNRISSLTPVAHALYGRRPGDEVHVEAPGGTIRLLLESVQSEAAQEEYG